MTSCCTGMRRRVTSLRTREHRSAHSMRMHPLQRIPAPGTAHLDPESRIPDQDPGPAIARQLQQNRMQPEVALVTAIGIGVKIRFQGVVNGVTERTVREDWDIDKDKDMDKAGEK